MSTWKRTFGNKVTTSLAIVAALVSSALPSQARPDPRDGVAENVPAVEIALRHLTARADALGVGKADAATVRVTDAYRTKMTGVTHVYVQQQVDGIPVVDGTATVNVRPDGRVVHVASHLWRDVHGATSGRVVLDAMEALGEALRHLGLDATRVDASRGQATAELVYETVASGTRLRLAWELAIRETTRSHWWRIAVDAATGRVLSQDDYAIHEPAPHGGGRESAGTGPTVVRPARPVSPAKAARDGAAYRVYGLPLESPNDGERTLVENPADAVASPYGWHDTNGSPGPEATTTRGNNVQAYPDYTGTSLSGPALEPDGGEDLLFDFPIDFSMPPHAWREAAVTNLFYWNNVTHDVLYRYGFDEPAGNFQEKNYRGRGGKSADAVRAEAHDGGGVDNAVFFVTPDGSPPRMQMFLWSRGLTRGALLDGSLDAGVIVHEYGHGISTRLTGGPDRADCVFNAESGSEGWSDWYGLALTARKGDVSKPRGIGTYVLGQGDRHQQGIRPTAYSTDKRVNPSTYDSVKTAAIPHGVGHVWATMLWEMYVNLVKEHGFNPNVYAPWTKGGNNLAIQLVTDGLKMQPCNPGFVDSRDAILAADRALTGGENQCLIWAAFAKRGLGMGARQGDPNSVADGTESHALPRDC